MEGFSCYKPATGCNKAGLALPVLDYPHKDGACSITGGYVYRGQAIKPLAGAYVYADFCSGAIWAIPNFGSTTNLQPVPLLGKGPSISSFAEDAAGELYLLSFDGKIYRVDP